MQKKIKSDLEKMVKNDCNMMPNPAGDEKDIILLNAPDMDLFRYYVELNEPEVFQHDLMNFAETHQNEVDRKFFNHSGKGVRKFNKTNKTLPLNNKKRTRIPITYPGWYHGFIDDTWINFWTYQNSNSSGHIELYDHIVGQKKVSCKIPVIYRGKNQKSTIWIAKKLPGNYEQFTSKDMVLVRPSNGDYSGLKGHMLKNLFVTHDIFDHIKFHVDKGARIIKFNRFSVKLNGIVTCKSWEVGGTVRNVDPGDSYNGSPSIYKYKQSLLNYPDSPILRIAANELGRAWCPKYGADWDEIWCSEFATWCFGRAGNTIFKTPMGGIEAIMRALIPKQLFLSSEVKYLGRKRIFQELTDLVQPGFWVSTKNGGHTEIFWRWKTTGSKECTFDIINGNSGSKVKLGEDKIANEKGVGTHPNNNIQGARFRTEYMNWKGMVDWQLGRERQEIDINGIAYYVFDGFGNTNRNLPNPTQIKKITIGKGRWHAEPIDF